MVIALLVDLDDTLMDDRQAMARAVLQLRAKRELVARGAAGDGELAARWDELGRRLWAQCAAGEIGFVEQRRMRLRETFCLALSDGDADLLFGDYLAFYEQHWALLPGAEEFLASTEHLPRAIITNGQRAQVQKKLGKLGLESRFQAIVTPQDCGAKKPDPKIFLYALERLGVSPQSALMVGDNLASDIDPALALGMKVFHVRPGEEGRSIAHAARAAFPDPLPLSR